MLRSQDTATMDRETRDYLRRVMGTPQPELPGVLRRQSVLFWSVWPGLAAAFALWIGWHGLELGSLPWNFGWTFFWLTLGLMFAFMGVMRVQRARRSDSLGRFEFLDGAYFWRVTPGQFLVVNLGPVTQTLAKTYRTNGLVTKTTVVARAATGRNIIELNPCFGPFLQAIITIRTQFFTDAKRPQALIDFCATAGGRAQVASQLVQRVSRLLLEPEKVIPIPSPRLRPETFWLKIWLLRGAATALVLCLCLPVARNFLNEWSFYHRAVQSVATDVSAIKAYLDAFPSGRHFSGVADLLEERLYQIVLDSPPTSLIEINDYLSSCPNGRHLPEVESLRDDHQFNFAVAQAKSKRSPTPLRAYLRLRDTPVHSRHRDEALLAIAVFYDDGEQRLREMAGRQQGEKPLLAGLLALLEYLKTSDTPEVRLAFSLRSELSDELSASVAVAEARSQARYSQTNAVIRNMIAQGLKPIIEPKAAFTDDQVHRREGIILRRIQESLGSILSSEVIRCVRTNDYMAAEIQVSYVIYQPGNLRLYNVATNVPSQTNTFVTKGLLRDYEIAWLVRFHIPGNSHNYEFTLISDPARLLKMDSSLDDPVWAPYAVTMYSAFYDFAGKLVASVGLPAREAPRTFRFQETLAPALQEPRRPGGR